LKQIWISQDIVNSTITAGIESRKGKIVREKVFPDTTPKQIVDEWANKEIDMMELLMLENQSDT
jgi:hypothetical protein